MFSHCPWIWIYFCTWNIIIQNFKNWYNSHITHLEFLIIIIILIGKLYVTSHPLDYKFLDHSGFILKHIFVTGHDFYAQCFKRKVNIQKIRVWSKESFIDQESLVRDNGRTNSQIHLKRLWKPAIFYCKGRARVGAVHRHVGIQREPRKSGKVLSPFVPCWLVH